MRRMERYLKRKGLSLNTEKLKIISFKKGERRRKLTEWKRRETVIEEVAEIRYLGYMVIRNGGDEGQIKDIKKEDKRNYEAGLRIREKEIQRRL